MLHREFLLSRLRRSRDTSGWDAASPGEAASHPDVSRLRRSLNGEKLAYGVDRLDYSKGLINRVNAFDRMWTMQPSLARTVSLLQIATPVTRRDRGLQQSAGRTGETDQRCQRPPRRSRPCTPICYLRRALARPCSRGCIAPRRSAW